MPKPWYFITATESQNVVTSECVKADSGGWAVPRTKRSENLEAARLLIPTGYHCIPDGGNSTMTIEWWIPKPTFVESMKD